MASYEALRHVAFGQYMPTGSLLHRLDPRAKLISFCLLCVPAILAMNYVTNVGLLILFLILIRLARLSVKHMLSSIVPALPIIIILALFQLLLYGRGPASSDAASKVLLSWGPILISTGSVRIVVVSLVRFVNLLFLTSLLTNTTTTGALTHGVESLLRPFNALGLPGHEVALVGAIALRFLPILGEQLESIMKAQASRGLAYGARGRWRFIRNARRLATLVVPLFVDAYRRSEEMMLAMLARCYQGGKGRTHLVELSFAYHDYIAVSLVVIVVVGITIMQRLPLP